MVVPIAHQAAQQIRTAQPGRVVRRCAAQRKVIAAAGAGVAAVDHEFLRRQTRLPRGLVQKSRVLNQFVLPTDEC